jgi:hypothetical protein
MPIAARPKLDREGIRELAEVLGIRQPIRVRLASPEDTNTLGVHRWVNGVHAITLYVHEDRTRPDLQRTLIHELVHAADSEAAGSGWPETYWANREAFERRAVEMAIRLAHHLRLIRPRGGFARMGPDSHGLVAGAGVSRRRS